MKDDLPTKMLRLMSDGAWHSTDELISAVSHRFSATLYILKKRGYKFKKRPVGNRRYEYRLISNVRPVSA